MNIVFFGPQGSGKGTQARLLAKELNYFYFEAGEFLRELGRSSRPDIKERIDKGNLIPGPEMCELVTNYFEEKGIMDNIIFDGFPRTVEQYDSICPWFDKKGITIDLAFVLKIDEEESVKRLSARRIDPKTGRIYNLITDKPGDGVDLTKLVQRKDDTPEAIRKRLTLYKESTEPLIEVISKKVKVIEVNGNQPIDVIHKEILKAVQERTEAK